MAGDRTARLLLGLTSLVAAACFVDSAPVTTQDPSASSTATTTATSDAPTTGDDTQAAPLCGDGELDPGELCDHGPANADSALCKTDCTPQTCGDGELGPGEGCDDGNQSDGDGCSPTCVPRTCGNGQLDPGEACDDGNQVDSDACTPACTVPACGDGLKQLDEECDDGANNGPGQPCSADCRLGACGDGIVGGSEQCDDGDQQDGDGCSAQCTLEKCGDGVLQRGEQCDDGNQVDADGCTSACKAATCGDGLVQPDLEQCDDANDLNTDACVDCQLATCGDGVVHVNVEECDDGNDLDTDACTTACKLAFKRVFVTSVEYNGDLNGTAGADNKCEALAKQAGLSGTFMAWVSESQDSSAPAQRFATQSAGPYVKVDGEKVADSWTDLVDGTLDSPIDVFETGLPASGEPEVWTNVTGAGIEDAGNKAECADWQSPNLLEGAIGLWAKTDVFWTDSNQTRNCTDTKRLYCFEQ